MAGRLAFHYFPGSSPIHRMDPRCKLPAVLAITAGLLHMNTPALAAVSLLLGAGVVISRIPLRPLLDDLKVWGIFLVIIFLAQALFEPGPRIDALPWLPASRNGIVSGALTCWRLVLIIGVATLFTMTTRPRDLQEAVTWALSPIPFIPARRVALMISLTVRFLPIILDQADEIRTANRARLGDRRRNPVVRAKALALPLLRRSLLRAGEITLALYARGYREDLPAHFKPVPKRDVAMAFLVVAAVILGATDLGPLLWRGVSSLSHHFA